MDSLVTLDYRNIEELLYFNNLKHLYLENKRKTKKHNLLLQNILKKIYIC